ncbi:MAG TPA: prepilin-type N-terminal cleavage/methylation domain-containing protein [Candidatus Binatia bacterium]|jgi:prepilin-type processing-associated H-X9-DG protein/prepilin-type N-terminal cleavage/methylation domain-containing protein|nr:prepilin-type N-terminal cleavage/methylation domain-containing protein [Candidatus Binatia bacterium]
MKRGQMNLRCRGNSFRHVTALASHRAFSLIELLIVVALMLLLTTLYWSPSKGSRQRQLKKSCQANLEKIYIAMQIYANDSAGRFPLVPGAQTSEEALAPLVPRYSSDTAVFLCPASKDSFAGESFLKSQISYAYYMGFAPTNSHVLLSDQQVDTRSKVAGQDAFSSTGKPPGANHGKYGGNFLFCDGHVEPSPAETPFALEVGTGTKLLNP